MSEQGSTLLLLIVVGFFAAAGFAAFIERVEVPGAPRARLARDRVELVAETALEACAETGQVPASLAVLRTFVLGDQDAVWNLDPYDPSQELDYSLTNQPIVLTVRSRGPDRQLGTSDDVVVSRAAEPVQRARVLQRLRWLPPPVLSALGARKSHSARQRQRCRRRSDAGAPQAVAWAMRDWSLAQRAMRYAEGAELSALQRERDKAVKRIEILSRHYSMPDLPATVGGAQGLLEQIGLGDEFAVDAFGATLVVDPNVGFRSVGADFVGGTDDDL